MAAIMRRTAPLALALLAACQTSPSNEDSTLAHAAGPKSSQMATMLQDKNYTPNVSNPADNQAPRTQATTSADAVPGVAAPIAVDVNQRREYEDVYVDLKDPNGQKGLVYYLMKPEEWHIDKVVQMTPTTKHWRFWRIARTDGKKMPEIDPLRPRRP